ncbi:hypothetical protein CES87_29590 [Pseudomonas sp. ERMR1:02]|nr:hypothetical protein CES87_29590 [Pseudomonas sp. ERMR1:02]
MGASLLAMDVNENAPCLNDRVVWTFFASRLAPTGVRIHPRNQVGCQAASLLIWLLIFLRHREAEWRFCAVGKPAWMPVYPRWAKDGPSRRAHGAGPERGHAEPQRGTERQGQEPLVTWGFSK